MGQNPNAKRDGYSLLEETNETQPLVDQNQKNPLPEALQKPVANDSVTQPQVNNPQQTNLPVSSPAANSYMAKLNQLPNWIFEGIKQVVDKVVHVATSMKSSFAQGLLKGFTDVLSQCSKIFFTKVYEGRIKEVKGALEYFNMVKTDINHPDNFQHKETLKNAINHPRLASLLESDKNFNQFKKDHPELKVNETSSISTSEPKALKSDDDQPSQTRGMR